MHRVIQRVAILCLVLLVTGEAPAQRIERFQKSYGVVPNEVLYVDIDIDAAEVELKKSSEPDKAELSVTYNVDEFELFSDYDKRRSRLDVTFDQRGWGEHDSNKSADVLIELPTAREIDLRARIKAGEIDVDLGGLSLKAFDFTTWAGEIVIDFSEPNKIALEYLRINTKIGETDIVRLGNARFRDAEINGGIGEMRIDFDGVLLPESRADIDLDIGETQISLPGQTGVKLNVSKFLFLSEVQVPYDFRQSGRYYYSRNYDRASQVLDLNVSPGLGELRIR